MIQQLVELSNRLKKGQEGKKTTHDALTKVPVGIDCVIDQKGNFKRFIVHERQNTLAERIAAKKGKARLLVDKAEEMLEFVDEAKVVAKAAKQKKKPENALEDARAQSKFKHELFRNKLDNYRHLKQLSGVFSFYESNRMDGIEKARKAFAKEVDEKQRIGNITFLDSSEAKRLHEQDSIYDAIIASYETSMTNLKNKRFDRCSVCGSTSHPVGDKPHGMIKGVPGQPRRDRAFVSYNKSAFESYGMTGNENSSICTHCAKAYVDGLNWLLAPSSWVPSERKGKPRPVFKNRKDISNDRSNDTAVVFWLRKAVETSILDILDNPTEDNVRAMFDSVFEGRRTATKIEPDTFYAITLSGTAARIAVRDWIETSLENLRANLVRWFQDIEIARYDPDQSKLMKHYSRFKSLVWNVKGKSDNDVQHGRIGAVLWKCAVTGHSPPLWLLHAVLNRIRAEQSSKPEEGKKRSRWEIKLPDRIALLKLYLNRKTNQQERSQFMPELDKSNQNTAYTCGRIFAVFESIQYHASGGNLNAGIRERFFSFASTMPATAFGRLCKLAQHHLSKIRGENVGLAVNLDKKLQELMSRVEGTRFPAVFSLEDQASFAIGYYHQRQKDFTTKQSNKEE